MRLSLFAPSNLVGLDSWRAPAPDPRKVDWIGRHDYAHRGLHGIAEGGLPENSLEACQAAIDRGLGIECDVQRSGDGQAMVFHDWELDRLTAKTGPVAQLSADQLGRIALTGGSSTIPTLRKLLTLITGRVPVLIEIKSRPDAPIPALCLAVRRVLEGYAGPHAVMSFDPRVSRWFHHHSPHTVRGLVISESEGARAGHVRRRLALWHAKPDFLAYDVRDLPSRFAAAQRARGLPLATWTVRSAELRQQASLYADAAIAEGAGLAPMEDAA